MARIAELSEELNLNPDVTKLIINRAPSGDLADGIKEEIAKHNLDLLGVVPHDDVVYEYDCEGKPTSEIPADSKSKAAFEALLDKLFV